MFCRKCANCLTWNISVYLQLSQSSYKHDIVHGVHTYNTWDFHGKSELTRNIYMLSLQQVLTWCLLQNHSVGADAAPSFDKTKFLESWGYLLCFLLSQYMHHSNLFTLISYWSSLLRSVMIYRPQSDSFWFMNHQTISSDL